MRLASGRPSADALVLAGRTGKPWSQEAYNEDAYSAPDRMTSVAQANASHAHDSTEDEER